LVVEEWKMAAARAAAKLVKSGMAVGLGSGSTVVNVVRILAENRPDAIFVPSSFAIQRLTAGRS